MYGFFFDRVSGRRLQDAQLVTENGRSEWRRSWEAPHRSPLQNPTSFNPNNHSTKILKELLLIETDPVLCSRLLVSTVGQKA